MMPTGRRDNFLPVGFPPVPAITKYSIMCFLLQKSLEDIAFRSLPLEGE